MKKIEKLTKEQVKAINDAADLFDKLEMQWVIIGGNDKKETAFWAITTDTKCNTAFLKAGIKTLENQINVKDTK